MSECVVRMEMPYVCITDNGYYGYCPMDRVWCIQRNAPPNITMREAYEAMTDKIPSWCPIICQLPEGHGPLVDTDSVELAMVEKGQRSSRYKLGEMWELNGLEIREALQTVSTIVPAERSEK